MSFELSLEDKIAADAKQFPIAQVVKKMPKGRAYLCKTSRGTSSIVDCKLKLDPGTVFFYQTVSVTAISASILFKRVATSEETAAYNRFLDAKNLGFIQRDKYFDRAF